MTDTMNMTTTASQELASLGHAGYSEDFAHRVFLHLNRMGARPSDYRHFAHQAIAHVLHNTNRRYLVQRLPNGITSVYDRHIRRTYLIRPNSSNSTIPAHIRQLAGR